MRNRKPSTYQTALARGPGIVCRLSPGRRSRAFPPGGLPSVGIVDWLPATGYYSGLAGLFEIQPVTLDVRHDLISLAEFALQDTHGERVENAPLNRALERPGAVRRIVSFGYQPALGRLRELDSNLAILEALQ